MAVILCSARITAILAAEFGISSCSWIGGTGTTDKAVGMRIQSNGTIVLAVNLSDAQPAHATPILLNGATSVTGGAILRFSADGKTLLSISRIAAELLDCSIDSSDNIYVAASSDGVIALNPAASLMRWKKATGGLCRRIDVAYDGTVAGLNSTGDTAETLYVFTNSGADIAKFAGYEKTQDIAISSTHQSIFMIGFENKNSGCNPVQVAYLRAVSYTGTQKWKDYDWPGAWLDNCNNSGWENNMADTRGYHVTLGRDGKLYCAFESAGGNHMFRRAPDSLKTSVAIVGGDQFHDWYNTASEHKTFFARYNPIDGAYLKGQQFCARLSSGKGNTVRVIDGDIAADELGRVYVAGTSAWGLPLQGVLGYTASTGENAYNPFDTSIYAGGAYLLVMDSTFSKRLYMSRLCGGTTRTIAARILPGTTDAAICFAGSAGRLNSSWLLDTAQPIQPDTGNTTSNGFFAVLGGTKGASATKMQTYAPRYSAPCWSIHQTASGIFVTSQNNHSQTFYISTAQGKISYQKKLAPYERFWLPRRSLPEGYYVAHSISLGTTQSKSLITTY